MAEIQDFTIVRLGRRGDGIAETPDGPVFVPFSLPNERVRVELDGERGRMIECHSPSPERTAPVCRHFGACGGCALQHLKTKSYLAWKRDMVNEALRQRGIEADVAEVMPMFLGARRRCVLAARRTKKTVVLGFHNSKDANLVAMEECPVMQPELVDRLAGLRCIARLLLSRRGEARITVNLTDSGPDVLFEDVRLPENAEIQDRLAELAREWGLARLTVGREVVVTLHTPTVTFGDVRVVPPPGAFLQAALPAQRIMTDVILAACNGAGKVADLFCGIGTFTFPVARSAAVTAIEFDVVALTALGNAARASQGLKPIACQRRDLFKEPLSTGELKEFDAVIFNPPRCGARAQAEQLAASPVPKIAAISCNPATLARDAAILLGGGYRLDRVTPIDQFVYSPHIEVVALFSRS